MEEKFDPNALMTLEELGFGVMWEYAAVVDLVERIGSYGERFSSNGC